MATDNIALVKRLVDEIWNKGNFDVAEELVAGSCVYHDPIAKDLSSLDAFKNHVRTLRTAFPDLNVKVDDIVSSGDKVYVRWTVTGTNKGSFLGMGPTNKSGTTPGISLNRVQNGKIAETWMSYDVLGLFQQLGVMPGLDQLAKSAPAAAARPS